MNKQNEERSNFYAWVRSLRWSEERKAYLAPDGSLWERDPLDEEGDTYIEVTLKPYCREQFPPLYEEGDTYMEVTPSQADV